MILDVEPEEISDEDDEDEEGEEANEQRMNNNNSEEAEEEEEDDGFWKENTPTISRRRRDRVHPSVVEPYAAMLYGLIHQRYLLTRNGLRLMAERYAAEQFGFCPRVYCGRCPVIPCGRYDEAGKESVRLYCPRCMDLYNPPSSIFQNVDGKLFYPFLTTTLPYTPLFHSLPPVSLSLSLSQTHTHTHTHTHMYIYKETFLLTCISICYVNRCPFWYDLCSLIVSIIL